MTHIDGEAEDDMPPMNLSKLVCLSNQDEKVCVSVLQFVLVSPCKSKRSFV